MPGVSELDIETLFAPVASSAKLGLAVSGGPDSLALMVLAAAWARTEGRPQLVVYSVDHGLRPEAADEVAMVLAEAAKLGLAARALRWEGDKPETGVQAAARKARYGLMAAAMAADGAEILLTAHHLGDQAETVLMRLAHGSGIAGLRGMDAFAMVERCQLFRPLLTVDPEDLRAVVDAAGLMPASDSSNHDRHYERVRWRQLQPLLTEMGLEPRRIGKFAERMAAASLLVAAATEEAWPKVAVPGENGGYELRHFRLAMLNPLVATQLLGEVLSVVSGDRRDPPLGALESLAEKLGAGEPMKAVTLHGCIVSSDGEVVLVAKEGPRRQVAGADHPAVTAN